MNGVLDESFSKTFVRVYARHAVGFGLSEEIALARTVPVRLRLAELQCRDPSDEHAGKSTSCDNRPKMPSALRDRFRLY